MEFENHPYNLREEIPSGTKILIVGTAPPPRFTSARCRGSQECKCKNEYDFDFFYGSGSNQLWAWFEELEWELHQCELFRNSVKDEELQDAMLTEFPSAARRFLKRHRIWMKDVLQQFQRRPNKPCSASDSDIVLSNQSGFEPFTDFIPVFGSQSSLETVAFTSEQAAKWTFIRLSRQSLVDDAVSRSLASRFSVPKDAELEDYITKKHRTAFWEGQIGTRHVKCFLLPSPSNRSQKAGFTKARKRDLYRKILLGG